MLKALINGAKYFSKRNLCYEWFFFVIFATCNLRHYNLLLRENPPTHPQACSNHIARPLVHPNSDKYNGGLLFIEKNIVKQKQRFLIVLFRRHSWKKVENFCDHLFKASSIKLQWFGFVPFSYNTLCITLPNAKCNNKGWDCNIKNSEWNRIQNTMNFNAQQLALFTI